MQAPLQFAIAALIATEDSGFVLDPTTHALVKQQTSAANERRTWGSALADFPVSYSSNADASQVRSSSTSSSVTFRSYHFDIVRHGPPVSSPTQMHLNGSS